MNGPTSDASQHADNKFRLGYRPDIEGLRAIAVLLVIAAHAGIPMLAGGFVGVDVFFVLSGYLITGLLVQEIHDTGTVALARFYARRLLRLMPALLLMICVTVIIGRLLLPVAEQPAQAASAATATLWLSNLHFAFQQMDYFSPGSEGNLFLHTWSLGVEEQFYVIWPVLLILAFGLFRLGRGEPKYSALIWTLWLLLAGSYILGLYWLHTDSTLAFYMMPSRAWQFALGALVFLHFGSPAFQLGKTDSTRLQVPWLTGWIGLAMLATGALLLDKGSPYPGPWALLPSVGAALVLIPTRHVSAMGATRWLSLRPLQAIGRISYSWYLWHWPVLLLGAAVIDMHSVWNRTALVLLSMTIATVSWRCFETPLRRQYRLFARPRMAVFSALAIMILSGSLALRWGADADIRMQSPEQSVLRAARIDAPDIYAMGCDEWHQSADVKICSFGSETASYTAVAMGDSIGLQWFPAYAGVFTPRNWRLLVITKSACPIVDNPIFYSRIGRPYTECSEWRESALKVVASLRPSVVILGSSYSYDYTPAQWQHGTHRVLQQLEGSADRIYVMRSTPKLPFNGPSCLEPRSDLYDWLTGGRSCTAPAYSVRSQNVLDALEKAVAAFANTRILDMTEYVCPRGICVAQLGDQVVFRDSQHLTASFAESLTDKLAHRLHTDSNDREAAE